MSLERAISLAVSQATGPNRYPPTLVIHASTNHTLRFQDMEDMAEIEASLAGASSGYTFPEQSSAAKLGIVRESGRKAFFDLAKKRTAPSLPPPLETSKPESRVLDVNVLRGTYRAGLSRLLPRGTTLLCGADYLLHVHIGRVLPSSIVGQSEKESGSLSYRSEGGQLLDVVLQEKGFELRTTRLQFLYLPSHGPSKPVMLGVRAPEKWGTAELRISVYLRTQLVQALLVKAEIADEEYRMQADDRGVVATLEFTQTEEFSDLAELPERALSISVNREGSLTHTWMVKGEQTAFPLSVPESLVRSAVKRYREVLENATTADGKTPRFPTGKSPAPGVSDRYLSDLADLGFELYDGCFYDDDDSVRTMLNSVRDDSDRVISIVRHDPRFAFPWQIFYDFRLPTRFYGRTPKVCRGFTPEGTPCGHTYKDKIYCVRGFWGYRHQLEEMIGPNAGRRIGAVEFAGGCPAVQYVVSTEDGFTKALRDELKRQLGDAVSEINPGGTLIDALAEPSARPAVVIVLGHLEQTGTTGPVGPRIVLERDGNGPSAWLVGRELSNRFRDEPWQQPNTIVLLMACESAATSPETLHDFVMGLHRARAAAVIGVECKAFSGLLAAFGQDIALALCNETALGQAMLDFRRKLLHTGHPLAFIFTSIGCADVKIAKAVKPLCVGRPA
jgi:hypothetical protein